MNQFKNFWQKCSGKGYYIALIACVAVLVICGCLYAGRDTQQNPQLHLDATEGPDLPVIATQPNQTDALQTAAPLLGQTVHPYSMDALSYNPTTRDWRVHNGIDIAADAGTPVTAAADGIVTEVRQDDRMGTTVTIRHEGGYVTTYSSLDPETTIRAGESVVLGQTIGAVGNSALMETALGDHLHFCVTQDGEPMDPEEFLNIA